MIFDNFDIQQIFILKQKIKRGVVYEVKERFMFRIIFKGYLRKGQFVKLMENKKVFRKEKMWCVW